MSPCACRSSVRHARGTTLTGLAALLLVTLLSARANAQFDPAKSWWQPQARAYPPDIRGDAVATASCNAPVITPFYASFSTQASAQAWALGPIPPGAEGTGGSAKWPANLMGDGWANCYLVTYGPGTVVFHAWSKASCDSTKVDVWQQQLKCNAGGGAGGQMLPRGILPDWGIEVSCSGGSDSRTKETTSSIYIPVGGGYTFIFMDGTGVGVSTWRMPGADNYAEASADASAGWTATFIPDETTPPTTTATMTTDDGKPYSCGTWTKRNVTVALIATDNPDGSGVKQIDYKATGAQPISEMTASGSSTSFVISAEGETIVSYHAVDNSGNEEAWQTCTIKIDKTPPQMNCPSKITAENKQGLCGAFVTYPPLATDNIGVTKLECDPPSGSLFGVGVHTVQVAAEDAAGNRATCAFEVQVLDIEPPSGVVDVYVNNEPGLCGGYVRAAPEVRDNCSGRVPVEWGPFANHLFPDGDTTVITSAKDEYGNTGSIEVTVHVDDVEPPTLARGDLTVPADTDPGKPYASNVWPPAPIAGDNCQLASFEGTRRDGKGLSDPYLCSDLTGGPTQIDWVATDKAGNRASCPTGVLVLDKEPPKFVECPQDIVDETEGDTKQEVWECTVSDNVDVSLVEWTTDKLQRIPSMPTRIDGIRGQDALTYHFKSTWMFPVGNTTLIGSVKDLHGTASLVGCKFTVRIKKKQGEKEPKPNPGQDKPKPDPDKIPPGQDKPKIPPGQDKLPIP